VELHPLSSTDSPFDDRHSIAFGVVDQEDPFEYQHYSPTVRRQRTIDGYKHSHLSPTSAKMDFGGMLEDVKPISENRRSIYPPSVFNIPASTLDDHPDLESPTSPISPHRNASQPVKPTFRGLFTFSPAIDIVTHLLPAIVVGIASSLIQPFMSIVIGDAFEIFSSYPMSSSVATAEQRQALISGVDGTCIKLAIAGGIAAVSNYLGQALWQRHGEALTARLREAVYLGVQGKKMEWFDMGMGLNEDEGEDGETVGAGGLMAKFTR
jgi:ATP-binding cassette subfamily B (MDR/TAP) protein 1